MELREHCSLSFAVGANSESIYITGLFSPPFPLILSLFNGFFSTGPRYRHRMCSSGQYEMLQVIFRKRNSTAHTVGRIRESSSDPFMHFGSLFFDLPNPRVKALPTQTTSALSNEAVTKSRLRDKPTTKLGKVALVKLVEMSASLDENDFGNAKASKLVMNRTIPRTTGGEKAEVQDELYARAQELNKAYEELKARRKAGRKARRGA